MIRIYKNLFHSLCITMQALIKFLKLPNFLLERHFYKIQHCEIRCKILYLSQTKLNADKIILSHFLCIILGFYILKLPNIWLESSFQKIKSQKK